MDRITRKDAEQALRVYCQRAELPYGHYISASEDDNGETLELEQSGKTFIAHQYAQSNGKRHYVITGGLALSGAYGGWQVHQIIGLDDTDPNRDGQPCTGVRTPFGGGYVSTREMYTKLRGAIDGLELAERARQEA